MNKNKAQKWVDALLSGDYKQGRGRLKSRKNNFCCLGVYCDLRVKDGNGSWKREAEDFQPVYVDTDQYHAAGGLPPLAMEELQLTDKQHTDLIAMNDNGKSFEEIAEHIKEWMENE